MVADWFVKPRPPSITTNATPPVTAPGAVTPDTMRRALKAAQPILDAAIKEAKERGREFAKRTLPDVWDDPTGLDADERPGDYLEERGRVVDVPRSFGASQYRYPPPAEADLVKLWKKDRRVVLSITAGGRTQDFYMPPGRLAYLIKEVAEQLAENSLIQ
jgi:hypothetical protein